MDDSKKKPAPESFADYDERVTEACRKAAYKDYLVRKKARKAAEALQCRWVKLETGEWGVRGAATLKAGDKVTVVTRFGDKSKKTIVEILDVDSAGAVAKIR